MVKLTTFQEFIIFCIYLRRGEDKDILCERFLGSKTEPNMRTINSVLRTWVAAVYTILHAESWWVKPEDNHRTASKAFSCDPEHQMLAISDCTNKNCQTSRESGGILNSQLFSLYYKSPCGKYCVTCSKIGGTMNCSPGAGGPAADHQCMKMAGLFEPEKWEASVQEMRHHDVPLFDCQISGS
jgi:hypothetical protein